MPAAAEADDGHARGNRRLDARDAVLDDNAVLRRRAETFGSEQEQVGCGFAMSDLDGAEYVRVEKRQEPGHREALADANEMAVRSDAPRHR